MTTKTTEISPLGNPVMHSLTCAQSGYKVSIEQDEHAAHWWTASVFLELGKYNRMYLNAVGNGNARIAVQRLVASLDVVCWTFCHLQCNQKDFTERYDRLTQLRATLWASLDLDGEACLLRETASRAE